MYLSTNKWIYNNVWLLNAIFTNKLQFCLVLFTYKLLAFWTFCFQFIFQLLPFSIVRFLMSNSFLHIWSIYQMLGWSSKVGGRFWYLLDSKNMPYFVDYSYLQSIWLVISSSYWGQNQFLSKVISHFKTC